MSTDSFFRSLGFGVKFTKNTPKELLLKPKPIESVKSTVKADSVKVVKGYFDDDTAGLKNMSKDINSEQHAYTSKNSDFKKTEVSEEDSDEDDESVDVSEEESSEESSSDDETDSSVKLFGKVDKKALERMRQNSRLDAERKATLAQEAILAFRKEMQINVSGSSIPDPIQSFEDIPKELNSTMIEAVQRCRQTDGVDIDVIKKDYKIIRRIILENVEKSAFVEPSAIQMQTVPTSMEGRNILGVAPTGSGKTAAYLLPLLLRLQRHSKGGPRGLVIAPTKELAVQIARECNRLCFGSGLKAAVLTRETASSASGMSLSMSAVGDLVRTKKKSKYFVETNKKANSTTYDEMPALESDSDDDKSPSDSGTNRKRALSSDDSDSENIFVSAFSKNSHSNEDVEDILTWTDDEDLRDYSTISASKEAIRQQHGATRPSSTTSTTVSNNNEEIVPGKGILAAPRLPSCDVLVTTPLVLIALLRHTQSAISTRSGLPLQQVFPKLLSVTDLVLDEADKLLETGFLEQVDEVMRALTYNASALPPSMLRASAQRSVCRSMYTATMSSTLVELSRVVLPDCVEIFVGRKNAAASTIDQSLVFTGNEAGKLLAFRNHVARGIETPCMFFVQSKDRAEQLRRALELEGLRCGVLHSDVPEKARLETLDAFRCARVPFLATTDVLGRGIDARAVRTVINYDFPQNSVAYIHRIGRCGRAGRKGTAVTYFTEDDVPSLRSVANVMKLSGCDVPAWMLQIKKGQEFGAANNRFKGIKGNNTTDTSKKRKTDTFVQRQDILRHSFVRKMQREEFASKKKSSASLKSGDKKRGGKKTKERRERFLAEKLAKKQAKKEATSS